MFGGFGGGDPFRMMQRHMEDMEVMMDQMMDPFGMMGIPRRSNNNNNARQQMIEDGSVNYPGASRGNLTPRSNPFHDDMSMMMPFGGGFFGGGIFGGLNNMMRQMQHQAMNDPNAHVYTQSTVIGMAPGADGRMQYYESSDSVRKAGDVKEVRKSLRDTSKGVEQMSIGHHIGDRAHIIEKKRDKSGKIVQDQRFVGLQQEQARDFDREFSSATRQSVNPGRYRLEQDLERRPHPGHLSIEDVTSRSDRRDRHASPYARASDRKKPRGPIIEEVE